MPQFKRVGHDFTMEMDDNADPEFWERVVETPAKSTEAEVPAESEESE